MHYTGKCETIDNTTATILNPSTHILLTELFSVYNRMKKTIGQVRPQESLIGLNQTYSVTALVSATQLAEGITPALGMSKWTKYISASSII